MNFVLALILVSSFFYSGEAAECEVHNRPKHVSIASNNNGENLGGLTVSGFANNLATLLGLSSDQTGNKEKPFFYSTNPLEIPSSTWLFHVEGLNQLSNNGIALEDNEGFNIDSIHSKLRNTGDGHTLNIGSIIITSDWDMDHFEQTLKSQISQMDKDASIKYIVIVCDDCQKEKSNQHLQAHLKTAVDQIIAKEPQSLAMTLTTKETARVRRARQAGETSGNVTIATMYSDEYPTMFNLFFWTSLGLVLILISIVYVFLTLDPGADTIIYRMTAPRLKVD